MKKQKQKAKVKRIKIAKVERLDEKTVRIHNELDVENVPELPGDPLPAEPVNLDDPEPSGAWAKFCKAMGW